MPKDKNNKFILSDVDYIETWKAMEECVELGLTKSIGLSNFNSEQIQRLLQVATVKPVTNQVLFFHTQLNTSHSLGLLWTSDPPVADTST
jgi:aldehyde reductase